MSARQRIPDELADIDHRRAKRYHRLRLGTMLAGALVGAGELAAFAFSGQSGRFGRRLHRRMNSRALATSAYAAAVVAGSWIASLPWSFAAGYLVERRYGLSRQPPAAWLSDRCKGLALSLALEPPLIVAAYSVIRRRPRDWWLILSAGAVPFTVLLANLGPVLIMPIFNRFEPIADQSLVQRIRELADRAGVPIADAFRMDMSRQSEKANAFFTGIGSTKRIVLADTLLDRYAPEEIDAVIAHELGHQAQGDMWRLITTGSATMFAVAYGIARIAPGVIKHTARRTGVHDIGDEAGLPVVALVAGLLGAVAVPLNAALSRAMERRTDRFALNLTRDGEAYASAMAKLAAQNLADPSPSKWVVRLLYSHPPAGERIEMARAFEPSPRGHPNDET